MEENASLRKLEKLKASGVELYPTKYNQTHRCEEIHKLLYDLKAGEHLENPCSIAGRVVQIRLMGKSCFANIQDITGRLQVYLKADELKDKFQLFVDTIELGDILGIEGFPFKTRTSEPTLHVQNWTMLAKVLRAPPEKWHGLKDVEIRYRQRYLDLIANAQVKEIFALRAKIIQTIRKVLDVQGFLEVETPVFQAQAGGAAAKPFVSFHEALETNLYLRIATELYLKRLIVGGLERVYEIGKCFRNEGIDTKHNPEFTMLEAYQAYADYEEMASLTERILREIAAEIKGKTNIDLNFQRVYLSEVWQKIIGDDLRQYLENPYLFNRDKLIKKAQDLEVSFDPKSPSHKIFDKIFDQKILPTLKSPCFVFDYLTAITPLAKQKPKDPYFVERFELFIKGSEVANSFSELNDPQEQRRRMQVQMELREKEKDQEAEPLDEDFISALEHGMPPTGGLGIGIDRLVMVLLGIDSIREVILFPTLKPKQ